MNACPLPLRRYEHVVLGHGGGGKLTADLIAEIFAPAFGSPDPAEDAAILVGGSRIAFTTDGFVVKPRFFPGGDVGKLAVCGTVNDLAVAGAEPRWLSAAFVLEEGLPLAELERIVASMGAAARDAGVRVVTGDTKVVERGRGDGVYIVTSGVGVVPQGRLLSVSAARPGDRVIVSGPVGEHGIAVMLAREPLGLDTELISDCACVHRECQQLLSAVPETRFLRDPTRGGLTGVLCELAEASQVGVILEEERVPVVPAVQAACELLGLDVLHVASEGRVVAVVPDAETRAALAALGPGAAEIGRVVGDNPGRVVARRSSGGARVLAPLSGEQLPRIC